MSFNYLEVAQAARIIQDTLPAKVESVELLEFALPGSVSDINVGLRLENSRKIVFSLKPPWTALYFAEPGLWRLPRSSSDRPWSSAFGSAPDWNTYLRGQSLESISVAPGDRVVELRFSNDAVLRVELFPARPNWILNVGGEEFRWKKKHGDADMSFVPTPSPTAVLREFETGSGRDWMERAYQHYFELRQMALLAAQLQRGLAQLQSRLAQLVKIRRQMDEQLSESSKAERLRVSGETLKAMLHEYPRDYRASRLQGPEGFGPIELDPKFSLADNVTRMFARYKKLQRTQREVQARVGGIDSEKQTVTSAVAKLRAFKRNEQEAFTEAYQRLIRLMKEAGVDLAEQAAEQKIGEKKSDRQWRKSTEKHGLRKFTSTEGLAIWIGRNHVENEELVIRLAKGNDMWLHLKGRPGAHAVIPLSSKKSPSLETLLDAATLVAYYSGVKEKEKAEVDYTFRKYVKRIAGNGDKFLVTYSQNKTLVIKVEDERLWRLLKQH